MELYTAARIPSPTTPPSVLRACLLAVPSRVGARARHRQNVQLDSVWMDVFWMEACSLAPASFLHTLSIDVWLPGSGDSGS